MSDLFAPMTFTRGPAMKNRFALAPLTNSQSHVDGRLSEEEFRWLVMRARGGFGLTMTAAAHVQAVGQGFPGQLGVFSDDHLPGLTRLAEAIKAEQSVAVIQLHHAGMRSPRDLIGADPVCPSDAAGEFTARALTGEEVERLVEDFVEAAVRSDRAGFDGVELHGAHGYVIAQFLSPEVNRRTDRWGGSPENRARLLLEIIDGVRRRCRPDFNLGVRLSPERFGLDLAEIRDLAERLMSEGRIDYLDMSLWNYAKAPSDPAFAGRSLMSVFTELDRGEVRLGAAGKINSAADARRCLEEGCDFVLVGRAAILHYDYPQQIAAQTDFAPVGLPVSRDYLAGQGLSPVFVDYMNAWKGFVAD